MVAGLPGRYGAPSDAVKFGRVAVLVVSMAGVVGTPAVAHADPTAAPARSADATPPLDDEPDPRGPAYATSVARPADADVPVGACSFDHPVCVHAPAGTGGAEALALLADAERAHAALVGAIGLPPPLDDGRLGGSPAFDLYAVASPPPVRSGRDEPVPGGRDRAGAFGFVGAGAAGGCVRGHEAARAYAEAILWGLDAGEQPHLRASWAEDLAQIAAPCDAVAAALADDFQSHPERAVISPEGPPGAGWMFPAYLDAALGAGAPGVLPVALAALAGQRTDPGRPAWSNEPDVFDALRGVLDDRGERTDDLLLGFAVARAFAGDRDDGRHALRTGHLGAAGRVRFDWSVPFRSLPRRLGAPQPVEPTGAAYLWIDLADAPPGAAVGLRMEWEPPVAFRWVVLRVAKDGSEASRVAITPERHATSAERNVGTLDGLAGLVVIGVNGGDEGAGRPFDPDDAPWEPHGYVVTVQAN